MKLFHWDCVCELRAYGPAGEVIVMANTKEEAIVLAVSEINISEYRREKLRVELSRIEPTIYESGKAFLIYGSD